VRCRRGDFPAALKALASHNIGADGYAIALLVLRYLSAADKDRAFEAELSRALESYRSRAQKPTHPGPENLR
jgi:hypothetical protein